MITIRGFTPVVKDPRLLEIGEEDGMISLWIHSEDSTQNGWKILVPFGNFQEAKNLFMLLINRIDEVNDNVGTKGDDIESSMDELKDIIEESTKKMNKKLKDIEDSLIELSGTVAHIEHRL